MDTLVKINNIATSWMEGNYNGEDLPADLAKAAFAAMHDIYNLSKDGGWTPCSVALPDIGEEVDVTYQINGKREVGCGKYIGNEQWIAKYGYGHDDEDGEVLAWKPCQEPYRGVNEMDELKPCPNECGLSAVAIIEDWSLGIQTFFVQCQYCGTCGLESKSMDQAIKNWNERVNLDGTAK